MAKIIVTKANSLDVFPHLECVLPRVYISAVFIGLDGRFSKFLAGMTRNPALTSRTAQNKRMRAWERHSRVIITEIDCEMFDKAVDPTVRRTLGLPEVISRKWAYIERLFQEPAAGDP